MGVWMNREGKHWWMQYVARDAAMGYLEALPFQIAPFRIYYYCLTVSLWLPSALWWRWAGLCISSSAASIVFFPFSSLECLDRERVTIAARLLSSLSVFIGYLLEMRSCFSNTHVCDACLEYAGHFVRLSCGHDGGRDLKSAILNFNIFHITNLLFKLIRLLGKFGFLATMRSMETGRYPKSLGLHYTSFIYAVPSGNEVVLGTRLQCAWSNVNSRLSVRTTRMVRCISAP